MDVQTQIAACRLCADRFAATHTRHEPRPVVWFRDRARLLIASQAPGARVHEAMTPFWDRSGERLRDWLGIDEDTFYDRSRVAIVPMAFCFPGYNKAGSDLPPPRICAATWRQSALDALGMVPLTLLIGGYAQEWHLGGKVSVTDRVRDWRSYAPQVFPLPHPSWRNTGWLNRNPWFAEELLPSLRTRVKDVLS